MRIATQRAHDINDVVLTSMRRDDVDTASFWHHMYTGYVWGIGLQRGHLLEQRYINVISKVYAYLAHRAGL